MSILNKRRQAPFIYKQQHYNPNLIYVTMLTVEYNKEANAALKNHAYGCAVPTIKKRCLAIPQERGRQKPIQCPWVRRPLQP